MTTEVLVMEELYHNGSLRNDPAVILWKDQSGAFAHARFPRSIEQQLEEISEPLGVDGYTCYVMGFKSGVLPSRFTRFYVSDLMLYGVRSGESLVCPDAKGNRRTISPFTQRMITEAIMGCPEYAFDTADCLQYLENNKETRCP